MNTPLLHRRQRVAQDIKGGRALQSAKAAGNLLMHLPQTQIRFGLIVGEQHLNVSYGAHDQLLMLLQAQQYGEDVALCDGSTLPGALGGERIGGQADLDELTGAAQRAIVILLRDLAHSLRTRVMDTSQQHVQVPGPPLPNVLVRQDQFAEGMGHAQRMNARGAQRHRECVMHCGPLRARHDVHGLQGLVSACGMGQRAGDHPCASHIQPPARAQHPTGSQGCMDLQEDRSHPLRARVTGVQYTGLRKAGSEEVGEYLADPGNWQQWEDGQRDGQSLDLLTRMDAGRTPPLGQSGTDPGLRARAHTDLRVILGDGKRELGEIDHLTSFHPPCLRQIVLTPLPLPWLQHDDLMGAFHHPQGVARLSSTFLSARAPRTPGCAQRLFDAVGGWGCAALVAVCACVCFELPDSLKHLRMFLTQLVVFLAQPFVFLLDVGICVLQSLKRFQQFRLFHSSILPDAPLFAALPWTFVSEG